jgi:glycosyltransferase involved in cell wall biosynthesis
VGPFWRTLVSRPRRFWAALALAWRTSARSDRPRPYHLVYLAEACRLLEWVSDLGITHVHSHFGTNATAVAMLMHELGGPPYSFTVHGPEEFDKPDALSLGTKVERSAFVVAISSFGRSQLYRWTAAPHWQKVQVVHCGLEPEFYSNAAASTAGAAVPDAPRLVCVGRICEQKAQRLLVCAAARLLGEGVPLQLVLAGDGEQRAEIEALIRSLGIEAHVRITGWISSAEVRDEILAARALVLPSFAEGLPVVLMEAMALRRPIVSTYIAGIPELVRNAQEGWLCVAGDIDALAAAMRECLATPTAELSRIGEAAHQRVLERHDIDREAAKLAALFARPATGPVVV